MGKKNFRMDEEVAIKLLHLTSTPLLLIYMRCRIWAKNQTGNTITQRLIGSCYTSLRKVLRAIAERPPLTGNISKTQIDRLGDRIRGGSLTDPDLRLLDDYRRSFGDAYETVVRIIRDQLRLEPTGRPAKSTSSIIEKLHRESIRLSQIQDIAGCRVIVTDIVEQEKVVGSLCRAFPKVSIVDRRANPSYGYRAVHVISTTSGKLVEIQVRTSLQHLWAELSEKLSDVSDHSIKYGGGPNETRSMLANASMLVAKIEGDEEKNAMLRELFLDDKLKAEIDRRRDLIVSLKKEVSEILSQATIGL